MFEKVRKIIADQLNIAEDRITPEVNLVEDLGIDSLDTLEMLMALEDEYGIQIANEDAQALKTVQDIVNYIESKQK